MPPPRSQLPRAVWVLGYGLGELSKPVFALASGAGVVAARLLDWVGKGIRGAPRDAPVADVTPEHLRGAAFGLRQALDTVGAFLGPLLAVGLTLLVASGLALGQLWRGHDFLRWGGLLCCGSGGPGAGFGAF